MSDSGELQRVAREVRERSQLLDNQVCRWHDYQRAIENLGAIDDRIQRLKVLVVAEVIKLKEKTNKRVDHTSNDRYWKSDEPEIQS